MTALPALFLGLLQEPLRLVVVWAVEGRMPLPIARNAHLGLAMTAMRTLPVALLPDSRRFDPLAAPLGGAVQAVLRRELFVLTVPHLFERRVE